MRRSAIVSTFVLVVAATLVAAEPAFAPMPSMTVISQWDGGGDLKPTGIAHIGGEVFVTEWADGQISHFGGLGDFFGLLPDSSGSFTEVAGIDVGADGNLYVARNAKRVVKAAQDGTVLGLFEGTGFPDGPFTDGAVRGVAAGEFVYVLEGAPGKPHRVWRMSHDGTYLGSWGSRGSGNGQFENPAAIAVGPGGNVYVSDTGNHRIQVFDAVGTYLTQWSTEPLWQPYGITVGGGVGWERIFVAAIGSIDVFDASGTLIAQWKPAEGMYPNFYDVAGDAGGNIWVVANDDTTGTAGQIIRLLDEAVAPICLGMFPDIIGTEGADKLSGTGGPDIISGYSGNDEIKGLSGDDVLCGGDGDDVILGGPGNDILLGENGNDKLRGAAGDDDLNGDAGSDRLLPETGNDTVDGGAGSDIVDYLAGDGPVTVDLSFGTATYEPPGESWTHTLVLIEKVDGTRFDDSLAGNIKRNVLRGKQGADHIWGFGGDDDLIGGTGDDVISGGLGADLLKGQADNDLLWGDDDPDKLVGGNGNDTLSGGPGDDLLIGGLKSHLGTFFNALDGGDGFDTCRWEAVTTDCEP
jgi:Ca2+-binding RTX toxin-like protein